jgi:Rho GTPase-activating protein 18/28/40
MVRLKQFALFISITLKNALFFYYLLICEILTALEDIEKRDRALRLLCLLLPAVEREVVRGVFNLVGEVAARESFNKMSLNNVAMILAPTLFPPAWLKVTQTASEQEAMLAQQVQMAADTCRLVEAMLEQRHALWSVPPALVRQLRQQYEARRFAAHPALKENAKPVCPFLI